MRSATNNWDFWTLLPEALHQVTIVMSDRGIPASYRHMHGFGSHTYSFWNEAGERFWVKFHFCSQQGIKNLTNEEAAKIIADDRESHQRDLYEAIERGEFPKWTMYIQVMPEADAEKVPYHPFDLTKVWPKKDYPLIEVGEFELNRNPENFFADVEQSAFAPEQPLCPGIGASPRQNAASPLVQLRRRATLPLGCELPPNSRQPPALPRPQQPARRPRPRRRQLRQPAALRTQQLRPMAATARLRRTAFEISGDAAHWDYRQDDDDYFSQPRALFNLMSDAQKQALFDNTAAAMGDAPDFIKYRHIRNCHRCDPAYGEGVAKALGLSVEDAQAARATDPALGQPGLL